jgi:hypothetical protein
MEILVSRDIKTATSTISHVKVDGKQFCFILEDTDRGLHQDMRPDEIAKIKVHGKTAIPAGRYEVIINFSSRFKQYMPLLLNVPGFSGVRIHWGNTAVDTEGCPIVGFTTSKDFVGQSKKAYSQLFIMMQAAERKEKIFITIR